MIYQFPLGPMDNFVYLIVDPQTQEAAIVDPAWDAPYVLRQAEDMGAKVTQIFLTHAHFDHVNHLDKAIELTQAPVYLSAYETPSLIPPVDYIPLKDQDVLHVGKIPFKVHTTPGHTPGGVCFESPEDLITGDTVFIQGCGRCDFPYSSPDDLFESLKKIAQLPDHLNVYAGHNYGHAPTDTLGRIKHSNIYLSGVSLSKEVFFSRRFGL